MLRKVFKYDFESIGRIWWIYAVSLLGMSILTSLSMNLSIKDEEQTVPMLTILATLLFIFSMLAVIASIIFTEVLIFVRFYKNFFTDEGYLTFTLPVSRKSLLLSKLLNSLVWNFLNGVLAMICVVILIVSFSPLGIFDDMLPAMSESFQSIPTYLPTWSILVYLAEGAVLLTLLAAMTTSLIFLCITLGSVIAKKNKILAAVGIYYGFNMVFSGITNFAASAVVSLGTIGLMSILPEGASNNLIHLIIALVGLIAIAFVAAVSATLYFTTLNLIERRLNLP